MDITISRGDITQVKADAIVNAANSSLKGGGGVDGAIHSAAGPELLEECEKLRAESLPDGLPPGRAAITSGHGLAAQWIVHAVGPDRNAGEDDSALLEAAFRSAIDAADRVGAHSVALPAIGAGAYGWPAAEVAAAAHRATAARTDTWENIVEIHFVVFNEELENVFREEFERDRGESAGGGAGA
ncbi:O-acetyl-ADP-ribose deacetylase [uncultured Corynebacterium sp.]|uniref:O-acetyl-ADP-ribose deacetylase n=1 Tax=uncultured Corynebacterium sp. TaxID=159447 RepID=UPI0025EBEB96|nr:O-acetyl-ADP-ribose deacetylase [uncultured Corynebacterium sp.]